MVQETACYKTKQKKKCTDQRDFKGNGNVVGLNPWRRWWISCIHLYSKSNTVLAYVVRFTSQVSCGKKLGLSF